MADDLPPAERPSLDVVIEGLGFHLTMPQLTSYFLHVARCQRSDLKLKKLQHKKFLRMYIRNPVLSVSNSYPFFSVDVFVIN